MLKLIPSVPKVCHYNYDMSKTWYVHFRMNDPETGVRKQFRYAMGINYHSTKPQRILEANALCKAFKEKLAEGWSPFGATKALETLEETLIEITSIQWQSLRPRTRHSYSVVLRIFITWAKKFGQADLPAKEFTPTDAMQYMDYLSVKHGIKGRTWNNRLAFMKIFFNYLVDRDIIIKNPFRRIKKQEETRSTRNYAYTEYELTKINEYLHKHERRMYYFCKFIYGLYVRPNEAARLQIKDIDLSAWVVHIRAENSKTKSYRTAIIPDSFREMFNEMNLMQYPSDYYVFSKGCQPGEFYNPSFDKLTPKLKLINKKLGINPMCTMYSFRHSGVIKLYKLLKFNTYECMQITGHTEMASFQNYLKTLGFVRDNNFRELMC
jgi:integrase